MNLKYIPLLSLCSFPLSQNTFAQDENKNILFIMCDDLRPELGAYGNDIIHSPNIDEFANTGVTFKRAYCNVAVSGASRASILTGARPTRDNLVLWNCRTDTDKPNAITMPEHFSNNGYMTISIGKIFHHTDEAASKHWDINKYQRVKERYIHEENLAISETNKSKDGKSRGMFYEISEGADSLHDDYYIADAAISQIEALKDSKEPFMLAVGFRKPHLPFVAPKKYWDLYNDVDFKLPDNYILKEGNNLPKVLFHNNTELRHYSGIPAKGPLDTLSAQKMIHGYYAVISFVDAQIGRVLDALEESGLDKTTTVVLIGDHGWNLGDNSLWCKHTVLNTSVNVAMIARTPGGLKNHKTDEIVEFVDIYPTLCDATSTKYPEQLEGESLISLLTSKEAKSKGYAISRWDRGFTIIKGDYCYTEWWDKDDNVTDKTLFDHSIDSSESYNLAYKPEYNEVAEKLSVELKASRGKNFNEPKYR